MSQHQREAEGGLGSDGVFVGQDLYSGSSFVYDPWVLYARGLITAPNLVLAGIVGSGKSTLFEAPANGATNLMIVHGGTSHTVTEYDGDGSVSP